MPSRYLAILPILLGRFGSNLLFGTSCHVSNTQPPSDSCHACTYWHEYLLAWNMSSPQWKLGLCNQFCQTWHKIKSPLQCVVILIHIRFVTSEAEGRASFRWIWEFSQVERPDRPTVTLFSVLYLLNQATDWQTVFGIWKPYSINHSY